jgi:TolA-binding protein
MSRFQNWPSPAVRHCHKDTWTTHRLASEYRRLAAIVLVLLAAAPCSGQTESPAIPAASDQTAQQPEPALPAPSSSAQVPDEVLDQINALREKMGGGVAEQLQGLFPDQQQGRESLQQDFNRRFQRLQSEEQAAPGQVVAPSLDTQNSQQEGFPPTQRVALRLAARRLDVVAADLEDLDLYRQADQIRAHANRLRISARGPLLSSPGG